MKFLKIINKNNFSVDYNYYFFDNLNYFYFDFDFDKLKIKKKLGITGAKKGVTNNEKKNSIKRDKNKNIIKLYSNLVQKNGKNINIFKNLNYMVDNFFFSLTSSLDEFKNHSNYLNFVFLYNNNLNYSDIVFILEQNFKDMESIFEIKTIKNNKKLKLPNKYSHKIIYVPKERRLKYILRSLNSYKENFKYYNIWERVFWSYFMTIINKEKSFIKKRKDYIYIKSLKFFKK